MFTKFSGIILWTEKISNLQKFYEDLLGIEAHYVNEKFISFRWNDFKFSIGEHSNITNQINQDPYRFMINFDVNEINEIMKYHSITATALIISFGFKPSFSQVDCII